MNRAGIFDEQGWDTQAAVPHHPALDLIGKSRRGIQIVEAAHPQVVPGFCRRFRPKLRVWGSMSAIGMFIHKV